MTVAHKIARAIISVSDKTGIVDFARKLSEYKVEIISTGGTAALLRQSGLSVVDVCDYTGFPEIMDGRIKTLHPRIHGGVLQCRNLQTHRDEAGIHNIPPIDLVVVNLRPFRLAEARGEPVETCLEHIDVGGLALLRAAAKNYAFVGAVTDPKQYQAVISEMAANDAGLSDRFRCELAAATFALTSAYDGAISAWLARQQHDVADSDSVVSRVG